MRLGTGTTASEGQGVSSGFTLLTNAVSIGQQVLAESLVLELEGFRQFAVPVLAAEVRLHEAHLLRGDKVALVPDAPELGRTHGVHALEPPLLWVLLLSIHTAAADGQAE